MKKGKVYSEVSAVLNCLGSEYKDVIPKRILNNIENKRDKNYNPIFNKNDELDENNIEEESIALILAFYLKYWCENEDEKERLKNIYANNEKEYKEKYSYDNLFKKKKKTSKIIKENIVEEVALVEYKESIFKRILNKILSKFRS